MKDQGTPDFQPFSQSPWASSLISASAYDWRYGGYLGNSSVTWELSETPGGTKLKLTHKGHETFAQDNPIFSRESGEAGWGYFVHESLKAFLGRQDS